MARLIARCCGQPTTWIAPTLCRSLPILTAGAPRVERITPASREAHPFCIEHGSLVVGVSPFTPVIAFLNDGDRP